MLGTTVKCGYLLHYKSIKVINQIQNQNKFIFSERVVGRNWTEKIVVLYSDSRWKKKVFYLTINMAKIAACKTQL